MALADIDTFVFVMLENRSFDHMLGYLSLDETRPKAKNPVDGLRSARAWQDSYANLGDGKAYRVNRLPPGPKPEIKDPPHGHAAVAAQIATPTADGAHPQMGGFVQSYIDSRTKAPKPKPKPKRPGDVMGYYDAEALPAFDFFARNFCICDHWFTPLPLGTQANRLMSMAGESTIVDNKGLSDFPDQSLVYDWLDAKQVPWRVYTWGGFVPFFTLMRRYRGRIARSMLTGEGNFRRFSRFQKHWSDERTSFPSVVFVEPEYSDGPGSRPNDDHPPTGVAGGQALLSEIYNVLVSNPKRWAKTLMIVTYDEHGGFFDHVPPLPIATRIGTTDMATTGPRVPTLLVSPHVEAGQVYGKTLDHTSFLQMLDERFGANKSYSPAVKQRQDVLTGRIGDALRAPRTGRAPALRPIEIKAFHSATHEWLAGGARQRTPHTPNAVALDAAVRQMFEENPQLAAHPDLGEMTTYVATTRPPTIESRDHIED